MKLGLNNIQYGKAGDCYSQKDCPQGRFSINLSGTLLMLATEVQWPKQPNTYTMINKVVRITIVKYINTLNYKLTVFFFSFIVEQPASLWQVWWLLRFLRAITRSQAQRLAAVISSHRAFYSFFFLNLCDDTAFPK